MIGLINSPYFSLEEFQCKCRRLECDAPKLPSAEVIENLNALRSRIGAPLIISSGLRCNYWNEKTNGVKNSAHLYGDAVDLRCLDSQLRWKIIEMNFLTGNALFPRVGIGKLFIHLDVSKRHAPHVLWLY